MTLLQAFGDDRYLTPLDLAERMGFTRDRGGTLKLAHRIRKQFDVKTRSGRINGKPTRCYDAVDFRALAKGGRYEGAQNLEMTRRREKGAQAQRDYYKGQLKYYKRFEKLISELRVLLPKMTSVPAGKQD